MIQKALTLVVDIDRSEVRNLLEIISKMELDPRINPYLPMALSKLTHFCRFVVIHQDEKFVPLLVFESNYDGDTDTYLAELFQIGGLSGVNTWNRLLDCCPNYRKQSNKNL